MGALLRRNTRRLGLGGRPWRRYAAMAAPTSVGSGRTVRWSRFPRTLTCPASQLRSSSSSLATSFAPQAESRGQKHNRVIARPRRSPAVETGEQLTNLPVADRSRDHGHRPVGDSGHGGSQIPGRRAASYRRSESFRWPIARSPVFWVDRLRVAESLGPAQPATSAVSLGRAFTLGRRPRARSACQRSHLACSVSQI
jgi:hypothetical protein